MAFIFSDLIVLPVLRIHSKYYGWPMALYILGIFLVALVGSALVLHYGFALGGVLPNPSEARSVTDRELFAVDATLFLNIGFALVSVGAVTWKAVASGLDWSISKQLGERILLGLAVLAGAWLVGGLLVSIAVPGSSGEM